MCLSQRGKSCVDPSWDRIKAAKRLCPQHQTQRWRAEVCKNDRGHGKWKLIKMGFSLAIYVTTKHEENLTCASMPCKTPYSIPLLDVFPLHNGNCLSFCPRNAEARDILPKIEDLFSKECIKCRSAHEIWLASGSTVWQLQPNAEGFWICTEGFVSDLGSPWCNPQKPAISVYIYIYVYV